MQGDAPSPPACTVLIPAHNEAATIRGVVEGALRHAHHVLVVDDGSSDGTAEALDGLDCEILRNPSNRGKGQSLLAGFAHAFGSGTAGGNGTAGVLTMDADGQHDPDDIPAFLAAAGASPGALVIGDRMDDRGGMPWHRFLSIRLGDFLISWATARRVRDGQCGMRLYPARLIETLRMPERERRHFSFETGILLRAAETGIGFARVPIRARYTGFVHRPSHYRPVLDTLRIAWVLAAYLLSAGLKPRGLLIALGVWR